MASSINDSKTSEISKTIIVDQDASTHDKAEQHQDKNKKRLRLLKFVEMSATLIASQIMLAILLSKIADLNPRVFAELYGFARLVWWQIIPMFLLHASLFFSFEAGVKLPYDLSSTLPASIKKFLPSSPSSSSSSTSKDTTTSTQRKEDSQVPQNKRMVEGKIIAALPPKLKNSILVFRNVVLPDEDPTNITTLSQFVHLTIAIMRLIRQIKSLDEYNNPITFYMLLNHSKNIFMVVQARAISEKVMSSSSSKKKTDDDNVSPPSSSSGGKTEKFRRFLHALIIPMIWEFVSLFSLLHLLTASYYHEGPISMSFILVFGLLLVFFGMELAIEQVLGVVSSTGIKGTKIKKEEEITKGDIVEEERAKEQEEDYVLVDAKEGEMDT